MENKVKRIGYLPRKRVLEIIDEISKSESISRSKVVGILVEEALDARGIANFGYSNISKTNSYKSNILCEETVYPLSSTNSSSALFMCKFSFLTSLKFFGLYKFDLLIVVLIKSEKI